MSEENVVATPETPSEAAGVEQTIGKIHDSISEFISTADVQRVYGAPIKEGDVTIIPTAEVLAGLGFGYGSGFGPGQKTERSGGGGGGGGGRTFSRPVAVIIVTPEEVKVSPVVDVTKIALAGLTTFGFMLGMLRQMTRRRRH